MDRHYHDLVRYLESELVLFDGAVLRHGTYEELVIHAERRAGELALKIANSAELVNLHYITIGTIATVVSTVVDKLANEYELYG